MSQDDQLTPLAYAAGACEIAICVAGIAILIWLGLSAAGRARLRIRLAEWRLPGIDFACFLGSGFVGACVLSAVAGLMVKHAHIGSDAMTLLGSAVMEGGFLLGLAGFHMIYAAQGGERIGPADIPWAVKSGFATFLVGMPLVFAASFAWEYFLTSAGLPDEKQELVGILENTNSMALRLGFLAVAAVLVPVAEELLFRAGLFRYLRTRMPRWGAILLTSAIFGALHVAWGDHMAGLPSLVPLMVLAIIYCLAYERTGSIGTTIVAHSLFNLNMMFLAIAGKGQ